LKNLLEVPADLSESGVEGDCHFILAVGLLQLAQIMQDDAEAKVRVAMLRVDRNAFLELGFGLIQPTLRSENNAKDVVGRANLGFKAMALWYSVLASSTRP